MLLERRLRVLGGIVAPESIDQPIGRDDGPRLQQQQGEDSALLAATEANLPIALPDLERAEDAEIETSRQTATVPRLSAPGQASDSALRAERGTVVGDRHRERKEQMTAMRTALAATAALATAALVAGCGGGSETVAGFRDGVYEFELSETYLREHGIPAAQARQESGVHELTIDDGRFVDRWQADDDTVGSCWGTYTVAERRVTFRFTGGCVGDWAMTYSLDGDRVTWSEIEALDPGAGTDEQAVTEVFNGVPWTRTGDVPKEGEN